MNPIDATNAEHYTWPSVIGREVCDGWHLHRTETLSVIEERMPPGSAEQRHFHRHATQFFYVLEGELTIELSGEMLLVHSGCGCTVSAQMAHQVFNRGAHDARFLVVSQPPSHGDRVAAEPGNSISKIDLTLF